MGLITEVHGAAADGIRLRDTVVAVDGVELRGRHIAGVLETRSHGTRPRYCAPPRPH